MTKEETMRVLAILKAAYPNSYNGMTKQEASGVITVWALQFADIPVDIVLMAVQKAIGTSKFPPSISEIKDKITGLYWESNAILNDRYWSASLSDAEKAQCERIAQITSPYRATGMGGPPLRGMIGSGQLRIGERHDGR